MYVTMQAAMCAAMYVAMHAMPAIKTASPWELLAQRRAEVQRLTRLANN